VSQSEPQYVEILVRDGGNISRHQRVRAHRLVAPQVDGGGHCRPHAAHPGCPSLDALLVSAPVVPLRKACGLGASTHDGLHIVDVEYILGI
jgi:hypothetical protein